MGMTEAEAWRGVIADIDFDELADMMSDDTTTIAAAFEEGFNS